MVQCKANEVMKMNKMHKILSISQYGKSSLPYLALMLALNHAKIISPGSNMVCMCVGGVWGGVAPFGQDNVQIRAAFCQGDTHSIFVWLLRAKSNSFISFILIDSSL